MQLVQQDAKKHGRKRVIRIMIAAAAAIAVLCGAAAVLHYASVSNAETTYHAEGASIRPDGTLEPFSYDFSRDAIIRVDTRGPHVRHLLRCAVWLDANGADPGQYRVSV